MKSVLSLMVCFLSVSMAAHADWPRFRGENGTGIAPAESKPPIKWSSTEGIVWKAELPGAGASSPIVIGDKVFVTTYSGVTATSGVSALERQLVCYQKTDGKLLWVARVPATQPEDDYGGMLREHGYASNTPASDGERVYVFFGRSGGLAFDLQGKQLWKTSLGTHSNSRHWGSGASVMLTKEHVIVNALDEGGAVVALDKATGKEVWRAAAEGLELAYSTPVLAENNGETDIVLAVPQEIWGINPANGRLRWYASHELPGNVSPGVVLGEGSAFVFGGFPRTGSVRVKLGGRDDVTKTNIGWTGNDSSYVPTPVYHDGYLYVVNDQGFALCLEAATGKQIYRERVMDSGAAGGGQRRGGGKPFYASTILADGRLYCTSRNNGTFVLAAKPQYELLSKNVIDTDTTQFNATPAVDGNRLYLRSDKTLYCVGQ